MVTLTPSPTSRTSANSTVSPGRASSFSTFRTASFVTRYCLPPVAITAYMLNSCNRSVRARPRGPLRATRKVAHSTDRGRTGQTLGFPALTRTYALGPRQLRCHCFTHPGTHDPRRNPLHCPLRPDRRGRGHPGPAEELGA